MKLKDEMFQVVQILYKEVCGEAKSPSSVKERDVSQRKLEQY